MDEPVPGVSSWHDQLRLAVALIEGASTTMAGVDVLVAAGWRPPADVLVVPSENRVRVQRAAYDRLDRDALARAFGAPGPPLSPSLTVVEPDGTLTEIEGNGP